MTKPPDRRFESQKKNLGKALQALDASVSQPVAEPRDLSGIVKDFEIAYELSWKAREMCDRIRQKYAPAFQAMFILFSKEA